MKKTLEKNLERIVWHAPEFEYVHKDIIWYWLSIITASVLFLVAVRQRNLLFALFIVVAEFLLVHWAKEYPKTLRFSITKRGIEIGDLDKYNYEHISGFYVIQHEDHGELILKTDLRIHPYVKILLVKEDIADIKTFLKNHIAEMKYEESLTDHFEKMIGF